MTPTELKAIRLKLGLTQAEMAARLNMYDGASVSRYERGVVRITPKTAAMVRLIEKIKEN